MSVDYYAKKIRLTPKTAATSMWIRKDANNRNSKWKNHRENVKLERSHIVKNSIVKCKIPTSSYLVHV